MSMDYIRRYYGVPAKRGGRVEYLSADGTKHSGAITSASHHIRVRFDGRKHAVSIHPTDPNLRYLDEGKVEA